MHEENASMLSNSLITPFSPTFILGRKVGSTLMPEIDDSVLKDDHS